MNSDIKIGDKVRVTSSQVLSSGRTGYDTVGRVGTVVCFPTGTGNDRRGFKKYGIDFGMNVGGHSLEGTCEDSHGLWVSTPFFFRVTPEPKRNSL